MSYMQTLGAHPVILFDGNRHIQQFLRDSSLSLKDCQRDLWAVSNQLASHIHANRIPTMSLSTPFELSAAEGVQLNQKWLKESLDLDRVPLLLPMLYDQDSNDQKLYDSFSACETIAKLLPDPYYADKIIFIDELGGLPSTRRKNAAHVLVNLQQEYGEIGAEIRLSDMPLSHKVRHLQNLEAMQKILSHCETNTTGLITSSNAGTSELKRNPLIHNIITDRPMISPSLPLELEKTQLKTSLLRNGLQVYVRTADGANGPAGAGSLDDSCNTCNQFSNYYPSINESKTIVGDSAGQSSAKSSTVKGLDLRREDKVGNFNLTKFKKLMENSFKKEFDIDHYLARVHESVAAVIVVGDYAGCALITWEISPLTGRKVVYLDKLAVDPLAQGAHGVADIMLIQMIRRLFPDEVLWRSRKGNKVNKWYFERSNGHMLLKDSIWTMFWISKAKIPPVDEYKAICSNIEASLR